MAATITFDTGTTITPSTSNLTFLKTPLEAIGLLAANLVKDTTTELIYKITKGTGTYADTYLRIRAASNALYAQMGTGYDNATQVITGAGTERRLAYSTQYSCYVRTVLTSDGTFGYAEFVRTSDTAISELTLGYVQCTNTTLTAATTPLTLGLCNVANYTSTIYKGFARQRWAYNTGTAFVHGVQSPVGDTYTQIQPGAGYLLPSATLGSRSNYMLGASGEAQVMASNNLPSFIESNTHCPIYSAAYGLHFAEGSSQGVVTNLPIFSGGRIMGYNSNLALCNPLLGNGDRIVVTAGSEEYVKIDICGVAVREV